MTAAQHSLGISMFLKILPNIDLDSDVIITPSLKIEGDKKKTSMFITQHGVALKHYYTKDNPIGIPELQKMKVKGKITWDDSDIMEFLEKMVNQHILPKLKKAGSTKPAPAGEFVPVDDEAPF